MSSNQTSAPAAHHEPNYLLIFVGLLLLTVATVAVSQAHLPRAPAVLIGAGIALCKALLVIMFFMHLKYEGKLIYLVALFPVFLVVTMLIGFFPDLGLGR